MKVKEFNIIIAGYGGQGILTLADVIAKAAFLEGKDVKQSELHGLSQRGGSLIIHLRIGDKIYSQLVSRGEANLIIALDALEALRAVNFLKKKGKIVVNKKIFKIEESLEKILSKLKKYGKVYAIEADKIVEKITGDITYVNTFILGFILSKKLLPLKKESVWKALSARIRAEFLEGNKKVFSKAFG